MAKKTTKRSRQLKKQRQREAALRKEREIEEAVPEIEEIDAEEELSSDEDISLPGEDEEGDGDEVEEKDLLLVSHGPKSLSELDKKREAQKKTIEVRHITWDTEDVISNIINDPTTEADEKANEITSVAQEMKDKINQILGKKKDFTEDDFDFELAQAQVLGKGITVAEWLKGKLASASRSKLKDSDFALIKDDDSGKKIRRYPIHDKVHVRNALSLAAQMIEKGGQDEEDARFALSKIRAAAKEMGIGQPSEKNNNGFIIEKDLNGDYRWVGWATNRYFDKDKDVLTDAGHKEFTEYLDNTPEWTVDFRPWHEKELAFTHPADAWMYKDGFMIYSGILEENEAMNLMNLARKETLGMSHGFIPLQRSKDNKHIIEKFRTFEVSVLPLHFAANPFTNLEVIAKEANIVNKKEQFLREIVGDERVDLLLEQSKNVAEYLDEAGVPSKELDEETPEDEVSKKDEETDAFSPEENKVLDAIANRLGMPEQEKAFKEFREELIESRENFAVLGTVIKEALDRLDAIEKETEKTAEDKLADMISSPASKKFLFEGLRSSQSKDTEVEDDDEILKSVPQVDNWLSDVTQTEALDPEFVKSNI